MRWCYFPVWWGGGKGGRRDTTGFPLVLNWDREIIFFRKIELTIFNNQHINIRVFWELLPFSWKICFIFACSPWYFSPEKVKKTGTKNQPNFLGHSIIRVFRRFAFEQIGSRIGSYIETIAECEEIETLLSRSRNGHPFLKCFACLCSLSLPLHSCIPQICLCIPAFLYSIFFLHSKVRAPACQILLCFPA